MMCDSGSYTTMEAVRSEFEIWLFCYEFCDPGLLINLTRTIVRIYSRATDWS